jgi:hypothetical protein
MVCHVQPIDPPESAADVLDTEAPSHPSVLDLYTMPDSRQSAFFRNRSSLPRHARRKQALVTGDIDAAEMPFVGLCR